MTIICPRFSGRTKKNTLLWAAKTYQAAAAAILLNWRQLPGQLAAQLGGGGGGQNWAEQSGKWEGPGTEAKKIWWCPIECPKWCWDWVNFGSSKKERKGDYAGDLYSSRKQRCSKRRDGKKLNQPRKKQKQKKQAGTLCRTVHYYLHGRALHYQVEKKGGKEEAESTTSQATLNKNCVWTMQISSSAQMLIFLCVFVCLSCISPPLLFRKNHLTRQRQSELEAIRNGGTSFCCQKLHSKGHILILTDQPSEDQEQQSTPKIAMQCEY